MSTDTEVTSQALAPVPQAGQLAPRRTRQETNILLVGPGNAGVDMLLMYMQFSSPAESPSLWLAVVDMDGMLLAERFDNLKPPVEPKVPADNASSEEKERYTRLKKRYDVALKEHNNVQEWLTSERFSKIQLNKTVPINGTIASETEQPPEPADQDPEDRNTLWGAGGDIKVGKRAFLAHREEFRKLFKGKHLINTVGCGGGGTGTPVMLGCAELAKEMGIPHWSLLFTPGQDSGSKTIICHILKKELRKLGQVSVFHNANLDEKKKKKLGHRASLHYINKQCWIAMWVIHQYTQRTGTSFNMDHKDLLTAFTFGPDVYIGQATSEPLNWDPTIEDSVPAIEADALLPQLKAHSFQNSNIEAGAMLSIFKGPIITAGLYEDVKKGMIVQMHCPPGAFIKEQILEDETESCITVGVIVVGTFKRTEDQEEEEKRLDALAAKTSTIGTPPAPGPSTPPSVQNGNAKGEEDYVVCSITVGGKSTTTRIPRVVYLDYRRDYEKSQQRGMVGNDVFEAHRRTFDQYGPKPDLRTEVKEVGDGARVGV